MEEKIGKVTPEWHPVAERRSVKSKARHGVTPSIDVLTWSTHVSNGRGSHLERQLHVGKKTTQKESGAENNMTMQYGGATGLLAIREESAKFETYHSTP